MNIYNYNGRSIALEISIDEECNERLIADHALMIVEEYCNKYRMQPIAIKMLDGRRQYSFIDFIDYGVTPVY